MSNTKESQLEINKAVSTLKTNLKKLRSDATEWHNTQFKSANDSLYAMFAELYTFYEQCKNNIDDDVETQVRKYVSEACKRKGIKFKAKKPTLQALLVKYLFDDSITADCKRISSYVRVFTLCTTLEEVNSSNIAKEIVEGRWNTIRAHLNHFSAYINLSVFQIDSNGFSNRYGK